MKSPNHVRPFFLIIIAIFFLIVTATSRAADYPTPESHDFTVRNFHFQSGQTLPELHIHYRTLGTPRKNDQGFVTNAVLILHGTGSSGTNFLRPEFAGELFGAGQLLDAAHYYIVLPDAIGHGQSSKPSDGLRAHFPNYGYRDMVEAQYRLVTEGLKVNHLRLILGTSMGGMHTWLWAELHPDFMSAAMPLASLPTQIAGRNRASRRASIDAIRTDPEWLNGDYKTQPHGLAIAAEIGFLTGSNPVLRQKEAPTLAAADKLLEETAASALKNRDANDVLYSIEASRDYDPGPDLEKINAHLLAVNSADDLVNPPELGILEREIKRVKNGLAVVIPFSDKTRGHGTHNLAALWKDELAELLRQSEGK